LDILRRGWPFSLKSELEVVDDAVDHNIVGDEGSDTHLALAFGTGDFYRVISLTRFGRNLEETREIWLKRKLPGDRMWGRARNILCS